MERFLFDIQKDMSILNCEYYNSETFYIEKLHRIPDEEILKMSLSYKIRKDYQVIIYRNDMLVSSVNVIWVNDEIHEILDSCGLCDYQFKLNKNTYKANIQTYDKVKTSKFIMKTGFTSLK